MILYSFLYFSDYFTYSRLDSGIAAATMLNIDVSCKHTEIYHTKYQAQQQHGFPSILIYSSRSVQLWDD